jgi:hypothetical protein
MAFAVGFYLYSIAEEFEKTGVDALSLTEFPL